MKKILVYIFLVVSNVILSQDKPTPYKFTSIVDLYEFPTVGATGNLDVELPLYTISTKGFQMPLSLKYDQMGNTNVFYMGNQFGDAWVLNAVGTISRKCVDKPNPIYSSGKLAIMCNNTFFGDYDYESYRNFPLVNDERYYALNPSHTSREKPDIYTFSFMGLTGKFIINKQGNQFVGQLVESSDFATIAIAMPSGEHYNFINITITDKNGYKYRFTNPSNVNHNQTHYSTYSKNDITIYQECHLSGGGGQTLYTGHIIDGGGSGGTKTIKAGSLVSSQIVNAENKFWENLELTEIYDKDNNLLIKYEYEELFISNPDMTNSWINGLGMFQNYKKLYLKKIDVIGQGYLYFNNTISSSNNRNVVNSYTSSVEIRDLKNNLVKKINFNYSIRSIHNIKYIKDYQDGSYGLSFHKRLLTTVNEYNTTGQDFLRTSIEYKDVNPSITKDNTVVDRYGFLTKIGYCKDHLSLADYKADAHILQKIKYPTGGSVVYKFEPHTFSHSLYLSSFKDYNYDNHIYQNILLNKSGHTANFIGNEGDTIYVLNAISNHTLNLYKKSGTTEQLIRSGFNNKEGIVTFTENHCKHLFTSVVLPASSNNQYVLKYNSTLASVSELKVYRFNYNNTYYNYGYAEGNRIAKTAYFTYDAPKNILDTPMGENGAEKVITFDYTDQSDANMSSGRVRTDYRSHHEMKPLTILYDQVTTFIKGIGKQFAKYDIPDMSSWSDSRRTDVKKLKVYDTGNQLLSEMDYNYTYYALASETPYLKIRSSVKSSTVVSKNYEGTGFVTFTAFTEYNTGNFQVHFTEITDALGKTTKGEFDYTTINNAVVNTHSRNYFNGSLTEQFLNSYDTAGNPVKTEFKTPNMAAYEKRGAENNKYIHGLLAGYVLEDGTPVTLAYGYTGTQVIAKLVNVDPHAFYSGSYQSILTQLDMYSDLYNSNYNEANLRTALNGLRTTFPNAMVTTYTYKPMVGISTITDENGKVTTYEYDTFSRLSTIKDHSGNILKEYQYNFTN